MHAGTRPCPRPSSRARSPAASNASRKRQRPLDMPARPPPRSGPPPAGRAGRARRRSWPSSPAIRGARCAIRKARRRQASQLSYIRRRLAASVSSRYDSASSTSRLGHELAPVEVRDRAGHPQHAVVAAAAESDSVPDREQAGGERAVQRHLSAREPPVHVAVAQRAGAGEPCQLPAPGGHHAVAHVAPRTSGVSSGAPTRSAAGTASTWQTRSIRSTSGPLRRRW